MNIPTYYKTMEVSVLGHFQSNAIKNVTCFTHQVHTFLLEDF